MTFLDTNILIYATAVRSPWHRSATDAMDALAEQGDEIWISRQILREYASALTRPGAVPEMYTSAEVAVRVEAMARKLIVADETAAVTDALVDLLRNISIGGAQVHDANIVATMQVHGIPRLLTGNVQDFDRFAHLIDVVPLV